MFKINRFEEFDYNKNDDEGIILCSGKEFFSSPPKDIGNLVMKYSTLDSLKALKSKKYVKYKNIIIYIFAICIAFLFIKKMWYTTGIGDDDFSTFAHLLAIFIGLMMIYGLTYFFTNRKVYNYYVGINGIALYCMRTYIGSKVDEKIILYDNSSLNVKQKEKHTLLSTEILDREYSFKDVLTNNVITISVEPKGDKCFYLLAKKALYYYSLSKENSL